LQLGAAAAMRKYPEVKRLEREPGGAHRKADDLRAPPARRSAIALDPDVSRLATFSAPLPRVWAPSVCRCSGCETHQKFS